MKESSIEEDIIILGAFNLAPSIQHISGTEFKGVQKAIDNLLSDYKRILKENEQLRTEVNSLKKENEYYKECLEVVSKHLDNIDYDQILFAIYEYYISKQKVKDKIEEIVEKIKHEENEKVVIYLSKQKNILQELLESEENNNEKKL